MSENEFESEKIKFLSSFKQVNISLIEDKTRDQNTNPKWYEERAKRITASNFDSNIFYIHKNPFPLLVFLKI
jgi:hypothetical protein